MVTTNNNKSGGFLKFIDEIAKEDVAGLKKAFESYGPSWKQRGGVGAFMIMARKFDRMEIGVGKFGWDIFKAVRDDPRAEGVLDDIRDARRYLLLIESELRDMGIVEAGNHRDNVEDGNRLRVEDQYLQSIKRQPGGGQRPHFAKTLDKAHRLNKELGIECHEPEGNCHCFRCLAMKQLSAAPHGDDCKCGCGDDLLNRLKVLTDRVGGRLKPLWFDKHGIQDDHGDVELEQKRRAHHLALCSDVRCDDPAHARAGCECVGVRCNNPHSERPTTDGLSDISHPAGCDCKICLKVRNAELRERARKRLYEDNPHPVACHCGRCAGARMERAATRGCNDACACNDCLADLYMEHRHE